MDYSQAKTLDTARLEALVGRAVSDLSAGYGGVMVSLGHRLGLYRAMADKGPLTARDIAARAGCAERYVREWLNAQVAGAYLHYHAISDTYEMTPEQAMVLANEDSPVFIPHAWSVPASMWADEDKAINAFRTGAGIPWGDHDGRLYCGVAAFYRNAYKASLVPEWLPALDGVVEKLQAAGAAGVADRASFLTARADTYPGTGYDLICFFDCLHDMGDPLAAATHAAKALARDGTVMLVEPFANDRVEDNVSPVGRLYYAASTTICCAHAISDGGRTVLGAQAGEARLADIFRKAGFTRFRRAMQTPFNLILEARL